MIEFRPCCVEDLEYIVAQDVQTGEHAGLIGVLRAQEDQLLASVAAWHEGRVLGAAGLINVWPGRAVAWALLSKYIGPHLRECTKHIRFVLDNHPAKRIEMVVLKDFRAGNVWARLLGFKLETPNGMDAYFADGTAAMLYARVT